ncbi:MAG: hypothetical protein EZS28_048944 [Streblomastix strix]|uniref:Uncharacterized protein n=1 Tax=Streblomastix strix TaxID=222440 RepID=A0A5J4TBK7_9EUKA|nr:MAG: hypothetical protein EZS28_048944 [Streblomastix strix]
MGPQIPAPNLLVQNRSLVGVCLILDERRKEWRAGEDAAAIFAAQLANTRRINLRNEMRILLQSLMGLIQETRRSEANKSSYKSRPKFSCKKKKGFCQSQLRLPTPQADVVLETLTE